MSQILQANGEKKSSNVQNPHDPWAYEYLLEESCCFPCPSVGKSMQSLTG